jgi:hypothetical protein
MLSMPAWEALGSPSHVAFGYDESGYYIVPGDPQSHLSVKVHKGRHISLGVIASALAGQGFPLKITLTEYKADYERAPRSRAHDLGRHLRGRRRAGAGATPASGRE